MKKSNFKKNRENNVSRREALGKMSKYAAFTAATTMMILGPGKNAAATSQTSGSPQAVGYQPPAESSGFSTRTFN